jgi:hypothetical protein
MFARITLRHCLSLSALFAALTLTACVAGSGTDGETSGIDGTGLRPGGIDGTGIQLAKAYGRVTAFGSFWVNGVNFDTTETTVTIDGRPDALANVGVGDVVNVSGTVEGPGRASSTTIGSSSRRWKAETVVLDHLLLGRVSSVDLASSSFVALGQTVRITDATTFDAAYSGRFASVKPDKLVAVSGFRTALGDIVATRISTPAADLSEVRAIGVVTEVSNDRLSFTMNSLTVDVSAASWPEGMNADALARGAVVDVWGIARGPAELQATRVAIGPYIDPASPGTRVEVEAFVTDIDANDPTRFTLGGTLDVLSAGATFQGAVALDTPVEVEGTAAASGAVTAEIIRLPFTPSPGVHTVSGYFYDPYGGTVADDPFNLFIEDFANGRFRFGYSYWLINGPLYTGPSGQFVAPGIPHNGRVTITLIHPEFVQPCAVIVDVDRDITVNVEVLSRAALDSLTPPRPQTSLGPSLSGAIYEMTPAGRQPVAGAGIWADKDGLLQVADTMSDAAGNYFLCNLPPGTYLGVHKEGFSDEYLELGDTSVSTSLDIELRRE